MANVTQIYNIVNSLNDMSTTGIEQIVDHSSFVAFAEALDEIDNLKDHVYGKLWDTIGKVVIAIDEYEPSNRRINIDSFEFGALLSKISFELQDSSNDSDWIFPQATNPYTITPKNGIHNSIFQKKIGVFEYSDVIVNRQINSAFHDERELAGFIEGLYTRMRNARNLAIENLENVAIGALAMKTKETDVNSARRNRHLLTEYKALNSGNAQIQALTSTTCKTDFGFLTYLVTEMWIVLPFIAKLTKMYNDGSVERFTKKDDLVVEMVSQIATYIDVYLKSNTYHDDLIKLPNYNEVPYWENPTDPYSVKYGEEDDDTISNIVAIMRDKDAVATTLQYERTVSKYDEWNDRTPIKMTAERSYMVDDSENSIIWYCD